MEFIKNSFPNNPSTNLLMNESTSPLNNNHPMTTNGKNKIITTTTTTTTTTTNNYITTNSNTINPFYTHEASTLLLNSIESNSKPKELFPKVEKFSKKTLQILQNKSNRKLKWLLLN